MKYLFVLFGAFLGFSACKSQKPIVLNEYDGPRINFGSGGGFTGAYTHYSLLPNGDVYTKAGRMKEYSLTRTIKSEVAEQMINNFDKLGYNELTLEDPGNLTYYIESVSKDKKHKLSWGAELVPVSTELKTYYMTLLKLTVKPKEEKITKPKDPVK